MHVQIKIDPYQLNGPLVAVFVITPLSISMFYNTVSLFVTSQVYIKDKIKAAATYVFQMRQTSHPAARTLHVPSVRDTTYNTA